MCSPQETRLCLLISLHQRSSRGSCCRFGACLHCYVLLLLFCWLEHCLSFQDGFSHGCLLQDCEVYNVGTDEWTTVSQTLRCTSCSSAIQLGDSLYIFGGHSFEDESDHNCTQILNTKTFTWQESTFKAHNILYFASISFPIPEIFVECDKKS